MTSRQLAHVSLLAKLCCRANCWKRLKSGVDECTAIGYSRCPATQKWPNVCHWHQMTKTWTGSRRPPRRWRWSRRAGSDRTKLASWWETTCSRATRCWMSAVTCAGWVVTRLKYFTLLLFSFCLFLSLSPHSHNTFLSRKLLLCILLFISTVIAFLCSSVDFYEEQRTLTLKRRRLVRVNSNLLASPPPVWPLRFNVLLLFFIYSLTNTKTISVYTYNQKILYFLSVG